MPRKKEISVSIIIPAYGVNQTEEGIKTLLKQNYKNKEIILVNDNPEEEINKRMRNFIKKNKINLINNPKNLGIAETINKGFKASKSDVVMMFCNDYLAVNKSWIKEVVDILYADEKTAMVVSKMVWPKEAWSSCDFITKIFTIRHIENPQYGGANFKRSIFSEIGYYNTKKYKYAGEDNDLQQRIKQAGYTINQTDNLIKHLHYTKKGKFSSMLKKEFRYGEAHGAIKRNYGSKVRMGAFGFEIRTILLLGFLFGWLISPWISLASIAVFLLAAAYQGIIFFKRTKWIPSIFFYPFVGTIILITHTIGAVKGFIQGYESF